MLSSSDSGPKHGARLHFERPGSLDGFLPEAFGREGGDLVIENVAGHSTQGGRSMAVRYTIRSAGTRLRVSVPVFHPERLPGLSACPSLYPGQTLFAGISADQGNRTNTIVRHYILHYGAADGLVTGYGPTEVFRPGQVRDLDWQVPNTGRQPIASIGLEVFTTEPAEGAVYLDYLGWHGEPEVELGRPWTGGNMWLSAWAGDAVHREPQGDGFRIRQSAGRGIMAQGDPVWRDCRIVTTLTAVTDCVRGVAVRVKGLGDYYALLLGEGRARLVRMLGGTEKVMADGPWASPVGKAQGFELKANGRFFSGLIDGRQAFSLEDEETVLDCGAVGVVCEAGTVDAGVVTVRAS
jgi:hypothetical protein